MATQEYLLGNIKGPMGPSAGSRVFHVANLSARLVPEQSITASLIDIDAGYAGMALAARDILVLSSAEAYKNNVPNYEYWRLVHANTVWKVSYTSGPDAYVVYLGRLKGPFTGSNFSPVLPASTGVVQMLNDLRQYDATIPENNRLQVSLTLSSGSMLNAASTSYVTSGIRKLQITCPSTMMFVNGNYNATFVGHPDCDLSVSGLYRAANASSYSMIFQNFKSVNISEQYNANLNVHFIDCRKVNFNFNAANQVYRLALDGSTLIVGGNDPNIRSMEMYESTAIANYDDGYEFQMFSTSWLTTRHSFIHTGEGGNENSALHYDGMPLLKGFYK